MLEKILSLFMSKKDDNKLGMPPMPKGDVVSKEMDEPAQMMVAEDIVPQGTDLISEQVEGKNLCLVIDVAKREKRGEDAPPLAYSNRHVIAVGVFDGMGGSGATEYATPNGSHTGAYLASRHVKNACLQFVSSLEKCFVDTTDLSRIIKEDLDKCISTYNIKPSGLRSALIRILPTTLAMLCAEKEGKQTHVFSYWCGDSRNYILSKNGLHQVSIDHLSTPQDPLENLRNDESLSNCICQDKPFSIEVYDCGAFSEPVILLSATDGCFGYLKSPMHFEYLLLGALEESKDREEWQARIESKLKEISGDDFSLSLKATEGDFDYWKKCLRSRFKYINETYIEPIRSLERSVDDAKHQVEIAQTDLYDTITSLWENYKQDFMPIIK